MSGTVYDTISKDDSASEKQPLAATYSPSSLQVKLVKQRDRMRKNSPGSSQRLVITNAPKKSSLMSVTRLQIPKSGGYQKLGDSPLVQLNSDSEDELFLSHQHASTASQVNKQLSRQLAKDGFQLDEIPDDEELDLIPPSDFRSGRTCTCCNALNVSCVIQ